MKWRFVIATVAGLAVLILPAGSLYYEYSAGASCTRCHEIRSKHDLW